MGALAVGLLLWPWGAQVREVHLWVWYRLWRFLGSPHGFTPELTEQLANALILLLPMAAATVLAWRLRWGWLLAVGISLGAIVELLQWAMLPQRVPDPLDALTNAVGAAIGVALGVAVRRRTSLSPA